MKLLRINFKILIFIMMLWGVLSYWIVDHYSLKYDLVYEDF